MKRLILLILLFGCGRQQADKDLINKSSDEIYLLLEKLPVLRTPLTFSSNRELLKDHSLRIDDELIKQIHAIDPALNPYGKIYQTDDFIAVIAIGSADILIPVLATFNKKGNIIDSFSMYPTAGGDIGYYSTNIVTLTGDKDIFLTDSVLTRKMNKEGTDEIPGTDSVSVTKQTFRINDDGSIEETI